jgi:hypothetical protein
MGVNGIKKVLCDLCEVGKTSATSLEYQEVIWAL